MYFNLTIRPLQKSTAAPYPRRRQFPCAQSAPPASLEPGLRSDRELLYTVHSSKGQRDALHCLRVYTAFIFMVASHILRLLSFSCSMSTTFVEKHCVRLVPRRRLRDLAGCARRSKYRPAFPPRQGSHVPMISWAASPNKRGRCGRTISGAFGLEPYTPLLS